MAKAFAVVNQKGGVGKTTTAVNLAACSALDGKRVLVVDTDPQGNATSGLGVDRSKLSACVYDLLADALDGTDEERLRQVTVETDIDGLHLIPATINLAGADLTLASAIARDTKLKRALEPAFRRYDLVVIDTAPSLGILTINSLAAADRVIIPIQCEYYALEGLSQLLQVVQLVQGQINPALRIEGVVLTMYDSRTNLSAEVAREVRGSFRGKVFDTVIPRNVRLAEAPSHGEPGVIYDKSCIGTDAYWKLYAEVFKRA